jgi:hypothetical protein
MSDIAFESVKLALNAFLLVGFVVVMVVSIVNIHRNRR